MFIKETDNHTDDWKRPDWKIEHKFYIILRGTLMTQSRLRDEGTGMKFIPSILQSLLGPECLCPPHLQSPNCFIKFNDKVMVSGGGALGDD